jgi:hypothetical protein
LACQPKLAAGRPPSPKLRWTASRLCREGWWSTGVTLPAGLACKACLHPCACPDDVNRTGNN